MNLHPLEVRSSRIINFSLISRRRNEGSALSLPLLCSPCRMDRIMWRKPGFQRVIRCPWSYCMLSFLYEADKPLTKIWLCTWHWALFFAFIFLFNPHNNSIKWMSLLCPEHWGLEKVNNWEVNEMGMLISIYLTPNSEFKANNSEYFWSQDCFTFLKFIKSPRKLSFMCMSHLLIFTALEIWAVKNVKHKYTSKHSISH